MKQLDVCRITEAVRDACIEINYALSPDLHAAIEKARQKEKSDRGKDVLSRLLENEKVALSEKIPLCQDTGMAVVFLSVGQDVHLVGGALADAVNEGVRLGYRDGYLRKSVVSDPILRENTKDNTPAILHTEIVPGDGVSLTVTAKGFGSENAGRLFMLKPSDGAEGVKNAVLSAVREYGANACPPLAVGVGVGGNFEECALLAKRALLRPEGEASPIAWAKQMERELLEAINALGIGPCGLGGDTTALSVRIETAPTHIAGLPVAVNLCCHVNRHKTIRLEGVEV